MGVVGRGAVRMDGSWVGDGRPSRASGWLRWLATNANGAVQEPRTGCRVPSLTLDGTIRIDVTTNTTILRLSKDASLPTQFASKPTARHPVHAPAAASRTLCGIASPGAGDPPPTTTAKDAPSSMQPASKATAPQPGAAPRAATNTPTRGWPPGRGRGQPSRGATNTPARGWPPGREKGEHPDTLRGVTTSRSAPRTLPVTRSVAPLWGVGTRRELVTAQHDGWHRRIPSHPVAKRYRLTDL